jgi:hypothetical protein
VTEFGNENVQALVVEKTIVTPEFKKERLGRHDLTGMQTQVPQNLAFTVGEF